MWPIITDQCGSLLAFMSCPSYFQKSLLSRTAFRSSVSSQFPNSFPCNLALQFHNFDLIAQRFETPPTNLHFSDLKTLSSNFPTPPMSLPAFYFNFTTALNRRPNSFTSHRFTKSRARQLRGLSVVRRRTRTPSSVPLCIQGRSRGSEDAVSADDDLRMRARICKKKGDFQSAIQLLQQCVRAHPNNGKAWQELSKVTGLRHKSTSASLSVLKQSLVHNPNNPYLRQSLGFLMYRMHRYEQAREQFERGIAADATHASLYTTFAKMEFELGHRAEARELYERAIAAGAADVRVYHSWGCMEVRLGNVGRGQELLERGLEYDPYNPYIWQSLASMAQDRGNSSQARQCYENALKTERSNVHVLDALAKLEARDGNKALARELFAEGVAADPKDVRILYSWSLFEYQEQCMQPAKKLVQQALHMTSTDSFLWSHLARIEEALSNYPLARALFKRACSVSPKDWRAWDSWSAMEHKLGNAEESEALLKESFRLRFNAKGAFTILANNLDDRQR